METLSSKNINNQFYTGFSLSRIRVCVYCEYVRNLTPNDRLTAFNNSPFIHKILNIIFLINRDIFKVF